MIVTVLSSIACGMLEVKVMGQGAHCRGIDILRSEQICAN
jgi:hypothetical protein